MAKILTKISIREFDKNWLILKNQNQPSRSWIKHLFDLLYPQMYFGVGTISVNNIDGADKLLFALDAQSNLNTACPGGNSQTIQYTSNSGYSRSGYSADNQGIVVGSSNVAATPLQDALTTRITHGIGAGQLLYGGCDIYGLSFVNPNGEFRIRRFFVNHSGGDVTVQECGIYSNGVQSTTVSNIFCIARDVVAPAVVVHDTEILEVEYTVQITV